MTNTDRIRAQSGWVAGRDQNFPVVHPYLIAAILAVTGAIHAAGQQPQPTPSDPTQPAVEKEACR